MLSNISMIGSSRSLSSKALRSLAKAMCKSSWMTQVIIPSCAGSTLMMVGSPEPQVTVAQMLGWKWAWVILRLGDRRISWHFLRSRERDHLVATLPHCFLQTVGFC